MSLSQMSGSSGAQSLGGRPVKFLQALGLLVVAAFCVAAVTTNRTRTVTVRTAAPAQDAVRPQPRPPIHLRRHDPQRHPRVGARRQRRLRPLLAHHPLPPRLHGRQKAPVGRCKRRSSAKAPSKARSPTTGSTGTPPRSPSTPEPATTTATTTACRSRMSCSSSPPTPSPHLVNQGWPYDYYWLEKKDTSIKMEPQFGVYGWFNEVCDPVEADSYLIDGVKISDFITPAWFNDGVGQRYDFMGLAKQPFWIRPGGYAQFCPTLAGRSSRTSVPVWRLTAGSSRPIRGPLVTDNLCPTFSSTFAPPERGALLSLSPGDFTSAAYTEGEPSDTKVSGKGLGDCRREKGSYVDAADDMVRDACEKIAQNRVLLRELAARLSCRRPDLRLVEPAPEGLSASDADSPEPPALSPARLVLVQPPAA
jgi:hypothetical protein